MNSRNGVATAILFLTISLLCACSTTPTRAQRIKTNAQEFSTYPPHFQPDIRAGRIETGFSPDMVLMAFGRPNRKYTETSQSGVTEVWAYTEEAPRPGGGISLGFGGGRGPIGYGFGVTEGGTDQVIDRTRVRFQNGLVTDVQQFNQH